MEQNDDSSGWPQVRVARAPFSDKDRTHIRWMLRSLTWWWTSPIAAVGQGLFFGQIVGMLVGAPVIMVLVACNAIFDPNINWLKQHRMVPGTLGYLLPTAICTFMLVRSSLREQRQSARTADLLRQDLLRGEKQIFEFQATRAVRIDNEYRIRTYFLDNEAGIRYVLSDGAYVFSDGEAPDEPDIGSNIRVSRLPISLDTLEWTAHGDPVPVLMRCFCCHDEHTFPELEKPADVSWEAFVAEWLPFKDRPVEYDEEEPGDEVSERAG